MANHFSAINSSAQLNLSVTASVMSIPPAVPMQVSMKKVSKRFAIYSIVNVLSKDTAKKFHSITFAWLE